jgi:hypothetical protein
MNRRVEDGLGERRKKEKFGFKEDRAARYLEKHRKEKEALTGKKLPAKDKNATAGKKLKELKFDAEGRKEYLLSLHKKKNERRVTAMVEAKRRIARENNKFRQQTREEARLQYNSYARVPILPNYTFKMPQFDEDGEPIEEDPDADDDKSKKKKKNGKKAANEENEDEDDDGEIDDDADFDGPDQVIDDAADLQDEVAQVFVGQTKGDSRKKFSGLSLHTSNTGEAAVTVDVKPLFGGASSTTRRSPVISSGAKNRFVGGLDFSDLPSEVAEKLEVLMKEKKGPSKMKAKVNMVKQMQKFHKIQKHSRKKKK